MKKSELIRQTAKKVNLSEAKTKEIVNTLVFLINKTLEKHEAVTIDGLGKFYLADYKGRDLKSPQGDIYHVKDKKIPRFKASEKLKRLVDRS